MEKVCEPAQREKILILVRVGCFADDQTGESFESCLEVAASLAVQLDRLRYSVGLAINGRLNTMTPEIDLIVSLYNRCVYREAICGEEQLKRARRALKRLRSPLLLPKRLKLRFVNPGGGLSRSAPQ
jgi:hypothetical protein